MPAVTTYSLAGDIYVNGVLGDIKWASANLTFSFPTQASYYGSVYGSAEAAYNFAALNTTQHAAVRSALTCYASVANFTFTEITETATQHATLRFAQSDLPSTAWAYFPSTAAEGGDAWFNLSSGYYSSPYKGNYAYATVLHEIGHAVGLEHPHEHYVMPVNRDSMEHTVMSYRSYIGGSLTSGYTNETWGYAQSLMMYDIAAVQHLYGANYSTNQGNTAYSWSPATGEMFINGVGQGAPGGNQIFLTVWDGGGRDSYNFSNYATTLAIDLRPGYWSTTSVPQLSQLHYNGTHIARGSIANALLQNGDIRSLVEDVIGGSAGDAIIGNVVANTLYGLGGNDSLYGGEGDDALIGGMGADRLDGDSGTDTAFYMQAAATDAVTGLGVIVDLAMPNLNSGEATGDVYVGVEGVIGSNYHDSLRGDAADNVLQGYLGYDALYGREGNDTLLGGAGADLLNGGTGLDATCYWQAGPANAAGMGLLVDLVLQALNTGDAAGDRFYFVENVVGSAYHDDLRGDEGANTLNGLYGNDLLCGRFGDDWLNGSEGNDCLVGGAGTDWLDGGAGRDTFTFHFVNETLPGGRDTIRDFVSGVDLINLSFIDANAALAGNQSFLYVGGSAFTGVAGQLNFRNSTLSGDINGDAVADFQINLPGVPLLGATDFFL